MRTGRSHPSPGERSTAQPRVSQILYGVLDDYDDEREK